MKAFFETAFEKKSKEINTGVIDLGLY